MSSWNISKKFGRPLLHWYDQRGQDTTPLMMVFEKAWLFTIQSLHLQCGWIMLNHHYSNFVWSNPKHTAWVGESDQNCSIILWYVKLRNCFHDLSCFHQPVHLSTRMFANFSSGPVLVQSVIFGCFALAAMGGTYHIYMYSHLGNEKKPIEQPV